MIKSPVISIVTPTLNRKNQLEQCIKNVLTQGYSNFEHIIVDGKSTDGTVNMLKKYKHLKWISETDGSHIEAVNKGIRLATGDIFTCLNSDDHFEPQTLKTVGNFYVNSWKQGKSPACLVGNCRVINRKGELVRVSHPVYSFIKMLQYWKYEFPINPSSYFYLKKIHDELGLFDEQVGIAYDYEFILRMSQKYEFNYIDQSLGNFLFDVGTITYDNWANVSKNNWKIVNSYLKKMPLLARIKLTLDHAMSGED